jgi:hypothetical protein
MNQKYKSVSIYKIPQFATENSLDYTVKGDGGAVERIETESLSSSGKSFLLTTVGVATFERVPTSEALDKIGVEGSLTESQSKSFS